MDTFLTSPELLNFFKSKNVAATGIAGVTRKVNSQQVKYEKRKKIKKPFHWGYINCHCRQMKRQKNGKCSIDIHSQRPNSNSITFVFKNNQHFDIALKLLKKLTKITLKILHELLIFHVWFLVILSAYSIWVFLVVRRITYKQYKQ